MSAAPVAILNTGLVTSVGLSAPASCAAIRAKISNPSETRFIDSGGEWIMAHQVELEQRWRGLTKLTRMVVMAIEEALSEMPKNEWGQIPLLLCVAEKERPGRMDGLDDQLLLNVQNELSVRFASQSAVVAQGRVSAAIALLQARALIYEQKLPYILIAATDSLTTWPTLSYYEREERLLTPRNSNGFIAGEAGGALLLSAPRKSDQQQCIGIGYGREKAHISSTEPLRANGLTLTVKRALTEADCCLHHLDYRITDISGEQYYFKEASLALNRVLRKSKEDFEIWHPAESVGETGAVSGVICMVVANLANARGYAPGRGTLIHLANDSGYRAAIVSFGR